MICPSNSRAHEDTAGQSTIYQSNESDRSRFSIWTRLKKTYVQKIIQILEGNGVCRKCSLHLARNN